VVAVVELLWGHAVLVLVELDQTPLFLIFWLFFLQIIDDPKFPNILKHI
jgi:hypothetical protein